MQATCLAPFANVLSTTIVGTKLYCSFSVGISISAEGNGYQNSN